MPARSALEDAAPDGSARERPGQRADLLLATKLQPPQVGSQWVDRQDLVHRLASTRVRLVLIDAPAGFGKTILCAQWRASPQENRDFAWLSLDHGDNDPVRLWRHVVSALARVTGSAFAGPLAVLRDPAPDIAGAFLPVLLNDLATLRAPVVLALDDYDAIRERDCQLQVGFLLRHLPPPVQMVLLARTGRGLPLGRLRAAGDVAEFRMNDLRFSGREAAAAVRLVSRISLTEPDLAELVNRTEGWPAGIYLAALSLRDQPSPGSLIRQFTGSHRYIADFLMEEVVSRQPERIRKFLVRTAILGRYTASLCDTVTGSGDAADIIDLLERENLFAVPLDDERRWFRYHHLFAQTLVNQLTRTEPGLLPVLHARASAWFHERGLLDEAVGHALAAGDSAAAVHLIAARWYQYVSAGRVATVTAWLRALGTERIRADPVAAHAAAWTAAFSGDRESVRRWLAVIEAAEQQPGALPDGMRSLRSSGALLRGMFGFGGLREMRESAAEAARLEDDPASPWYALARATWGWSLYLAGQPGQAQVRLQQALLATGLPPLARMLALSVMALLALDTDHLAKAEALARAARDMAGAGDQVEVPPQNALAYTAVGALYARQGRMADARREFERALRTRLRWVGVSPWATVEAQLRLTAALFEQGDREVAVTLLADARDLLSGTPDGAEALRSRLDQLGQRFAAGKGVPEVSALLTEQERRILELLPGALSRREIAAEMHLSMNTVKTHIQVIYRKLGTRSRQQTVSRARALGIM